MRPFQAHTIVGPNYNNSDQVEYVPCSLLQLTYSQYHHPLPENPTNNRYILIYTHIYICIITYIYVYIDIHIIPILTLLITHLYYTYKIALPTIIQWIDPKTTPAAPASGSWTPSARARR